MRRIADHDGEPVDSGERDHEQCEAPLSPVPHDLKVDGHPRRRVHLRREDLGTDLHLSADAGARSSLLTSRRNGTDPSHGPPGGNMFTKKTLAATAAGALLAGGAMTLTTTSTEAAQ